MPTASDHELVYALREGGHVLRFHTVPLHKPPTVARHTWNMLTMLLALHPTRPSRILIWAILVHDVAERWTGDTPAPAKHWICPKLGEILARVEARVKRDLGLPDYEAKLDEAERRWLSGLDMLELLMTCEDEIALGNEHIRPTYENIVEVFESRPQPPQLVEFYQKHKWHRTNNLIRGGDYEGASGPTIQD